MTCFNASELINCGCRVINKLFKQNNANVSAKLSKGGPHAISENKGPEAIGSFASPNIHPWLYVVYTIFAVQQVAILLNLPKAIRRRFSIECCYIRLQWCAN